MSMNREAYRLANEIGAAVEADRDCLIDHPEDMDMKKYQRQILEKIGSEKRAARRRFSGLAAAACAAMMVFVGTAVFGDQVYAAIRQISWSIGSALGLSTDLADYREVVNTSVSDEGYVITLQEAVVSEGTLVVNYTVQREDGQPVEQSMVPNGFLYVNGEQASNGGSGSAGFLDEEQKVLGIVETYRIFDSVDLARKNEFKFSFDMIGIGEEGVNGQWDFAFMADGSDLIAGTKRVEIGKEFQLPDGVTVELEEFTSNDLEQIIRFSQSESTRYLLMVKAVDQNGNQVEFGLRSSNGKSGYMQNEEILYDGRLEETGDLEETAGVVIMTLYAVELPEGDGQISDDFVQIGEPFEVEF